MAEGLRQIATLADPVSEMTELKFRPTGIQVGKMRLPLGVIGIIYEARPNDRRCRRPVPFKSGKSAAISARRQRKQIPVEPGDCRFRAKALPPPAYRKRQYRWLKPPTAPQSAS